MLNLRKTARISL